MKILKFLMMAGVLAAIAMGDPAMAAGKKKKKRKKGKKKSAKSAEVYNYPYGMAGCGLGSIVIKDNTMMGQVTAATLNATGYQTLAITTGTSNCEMQKADMAHMEQKVFVEVNLASLSKDAAQGEGRYLRAMSELFGCSDHYSEFASLSRERYQELFANAEATSVLDSYRGALAGDATLSGTCSRAIF
jgi:hypothetical protein